MSEKQFQIVPVGYVRRKEGAAFLEIGEKYRKGLKQLEHFTHVMVLWWADRHDNEKSRSIMEMEPPYAPGKITGVFASRAEYRPNPIGMTTCKIKSVDVEKGIVKIVKIDALDDTPVIDLKAYFPVCDRVKTARIPDWLSEWPEWMPEDGFGLETYDE